MQKCKLELYNADTASLNAMYVNGSRIYLNRWVPFGDTLPIPTPSGVMFTPTKIKESIFLYSPWRVGLGATKSTTLIIKVPTKLNMTDNSISFSFGMCFYKEPWWTELESMYSGITFTKTPSSLIGTLYDLRYRKNRDIIIDPTAKFILIQLTTVGSTIIWNIQGLTNTGTTISNEDITLPLLAPKESYYILWGQHDKLKMERSLYSNWGVTSDRIPTGVITEVECYEFTQNPTEATVPIAPLRDTGTALYPIPSLSLIEDATIQLYFPLCDRQQVNILSYLLNYTTAPFLFTDYIGHKYQVALSSLVHDTSTAIKNMTAVTFLMQLLQVH